MLSVQISYRTSSNSNQIWTTNLIKMSRVLLNNNSFSSRWSNNKRLRMWHQSTGIPLRRNRSYLLSSKLISLHLQLKLISSLMYRAVTLCRRKSQKLRTRRRRHRKMHRQKKERKVRMKGRLLAALSSLSRANTMGLLLKICNQVRMSQGLISSFTLMTWKKLDCRGSF